MNHSRFTRTAVVHCMGCKLGYTCISLCTLHLYHTTISNNSYLFPVNRISCRAHIKLLVGMSVSFKPPISTAAPLFVFSASLDRMCVAMSSASHSHTHLSPPSPADRGGGRSGAASTKPPQSPPHGYLSSDLSVAATGRSIVIIAIGSSSAECSH